MGLSGSSLSPPVPPPPSPSLSPFLSFSRAPACCNLKVSPNVIFDKKRSKRDLAVSEVFAIESDTKIYVNEFLPSATYNLLRRTRAEASAAAFRFMWVRGGVISVRCDIGQPIIHILSDLHLAKLS